MAIGESRPPQPPAPEARTAPRTAEPRPAGVMRTSRVTPSAAVMTRPFLVLLPVIVFLIPSVLITMVSKPTYTSEARILVAGFDVQAAAIPGFVEASRNLAETYARLVETDVVLKPMARKLDVSTGNLGGSVSASAIPDSAIIRIEGHAHNAARAQRLATAAADALSTFANSLGADSAQRLSDYKKASTELAQAKVRQQQAQAALRNDSSSTAQQRAIQADTDVAAAQLAQSRAEAAYRDSGSVGDSVKLIGPAGKAYSDRKSKLQLAIAAPVLLGLVAGTALATVVVNRRWRPVALRNEPS